MARPAARRLLSRGDRGDETIHAYTASWSRRRGGEARGCVTFTTGNALCSSPGQPPHPPSDEFHVTSQGPKSRSARSPPPLERRLGPAARREGRGSRGAAPAGRAGPLHGGGRLVRRAEGDGAAREAGRLAAEDARPL